MKKSTILGIIVLSLALLIGANDLTAREGISEQKLPQYTGPKFATHNMEHGPTDEQMKQMTLAIEAGQCAALYTIIGANQVAIHKAVYAKHKEVKPFVEYAGSADMVIDKISQWMLKDPKKNDPGNDGVIILGAYPMYYAPINWTNPGENSESMKLFNELAIEFKNHNCSKWLPTV